MNTSQQESQTAPSSGNPGAIPLSSEDRARMVRLYEETSARLHEMALIVARTLGMATSKGIEPTFKRPQHEADALTFKGLEIVCTPYGCGCYDHDAGTCSPC
jgi:hypothetical protein